MDVSSQASGLFKAAQEVPFLSEHPQHQRKYQLSFFLQWLCSFIPIKKKYWFRSWSSVTAGPFSACLLVVISKALFSAVVPQVCQFFLSNSSEVLSFLNRWSPSYLLAWLLWLQSHILYLLDFFLVLFEAAKVVAIVSGTDSPINFVSLHCSPFFLPHKDKPYFLFLKTLSLFSVWCWLLSRCPLADSSKLFGAFAVWMVAYPQHRLPLCLTAVLEAWCFLPWVLPSSAGPIACLHY